MEAEHNCSGDQEATYTQDFKDYWEVKETWAQNYSFFFLWWRPKEILEWNIGSLRKIK